MSIVRTIPVLAILVLSFGLRVFRLDGQSLWSDEGASVFMTGRSFGEILKAAAGDIHPPLYYLFLRYWSIPAGTSEFAVRFLSLAFGVLLVALVFKLGQKLAGHSVGLIAAFMAATSPFLIYYSQEARMYMQMAALSTLSVLLAIRLVEKDSSKGQEVKRGKGPLLLFPFSPLPPLYVLVTAACLYTQYFAFTIVLFENVAFTLVFWRFWRRWRLWGTWIAAQLAVVVLYLPWLRQAMGQLNTWPAISEAFSPQTLIYRLFLVFSFGLSWDMTTTAKTQALFGVLALAGLLLGWRMEASRGKRGNGEKVKSSFPLSLFPSFPFTLLYLAVPVGVMYYLSLRRPMYNPKFLLLATPPYYLLLALGIVGIRDVIEGGVHRLVKNLPRVLHFARLFAAAIVLLTLAGTTYATSRSLAAYYFDPKYGRDDYRGLSRYVEASEQPGDAIILNAPGQIEIFGYYYRGSSPVLPLPEQRPLDEKITEEDLKEAASKYRRVWVVFWAEQESDPNGFIERWLDQNTFRASNEWYGSVRLVLYSMPMATTAGTIQRQVGANLGNKALLLGYSLNRSEDDVVAPGGQQAKPGEVLQFTLFWQALSKMEERYVVFTHVLDPHEHIWGQRDAEPGSSAKPTTSWAPGTVISDNYGIPIFFGTPPGEYHVEIGLYLPATGQRLQVVGQGGEVKGDRVLLGPLRVRKADVSPAVESLHAQYPSSVDFGPLRLVGYEFYKLGSERGDVDFRRGDIARLALFWQAREKPGKDYAVVVRLLDHDGRTVLTKKNAPADGEYPTSRWDKGEVVLDQHKLLLDLPPGKYKLVLGLDDGRGMVRSQGAGSKGEREFVELQTLEIR